MVIDFLFFPLFSFLTGRGRRARAKKRNDRATRSWRIREIIEEELDGIRTATEIGRPSMKISFLRRSVQNRDANSIAVEESEWFVQSSTLRQVNPQVYQRHRSSVPFQVTLESTILSGRRESWFFLRPAWIEGKSDMFILFLPVHGAIMDLLFCDAMRVISFENIIFLPFFSSLFFFLRIFYTMKRRN